MKWIVSAFIGLLTVLPCQAAGVSKIQVATSSTGLLYATAYIADQMGYFREAGLDANIFDGGGGSNAVASVVGGSADFGVVGIKNMSKAVEQGAKIRAVGTGMDGLDMVLVARPDLLPGSKLDTSLSLKDRMSLLKGKTVAVLDVGGSSGGLVRYLLAQANMPSDSATVINMDSNAGQLASLKAKRIDAFVNTSPVWQTAVSGGYGIDLVVPARDIPAVSGMHYIVHAVRDDFVNQHPDVVQKYLIAIYRAELLIQRHPEKAASAYFGFIAKLNSSNSVAPNVRTLMWEKSKSLFPPSLEFTASGIAKARKFFSIPDKIKDESLVNDEPAKKAMAAVH